MTIEQQLGQLERILATTIGITQENTQAISHLTQRTQDNTQAIAHLTQRTQDNTQAIARLNQNMQQLNEMFIESLGVIRVIQDEIREMQGQVRGMQTENQRILRHLFGDDE